MFINSLYQYFEANILWKYPLAAESQPQNLEKFSPTMHFLYQSCMMRITRLPYQPECDQKIYICKDSIFKVRFHQLLLNQK